MKTAHRSLIIVVALVPVFILAIHASADARVTSTQAMGLQIMGQRVPVTAKEISEALANEMRLLFKEPPPQDWDFEVPLAVPAARVHNLRVTSVCREAKAGLVRFRLACGEPGACLPFLTYAHVHFPLPAPSCSAEGPANAGTPLGLPVVRPGDHVIGVWLDASLRLTAPVICLERGASGDIISVRGPEGHLLRARVTGPGTVEVVLP